MSSVATTYSTNHDHRLRAFATAIDAGGVVGRRCSSARSLVGVAAMEPEHTHAFHSGRMALPNPRRSEERHRAGKTGIEQRLAMKSGAQRLGPPGGRMIAGQEGLYVYTYRGLMPWQKLTVSVNDGVYAALHRVIGRGLAVFSTTFRVCMGAQRPSLMVAREPDACKWVGKPTGESPMSPERLAQRGEVWWVAFEPSVRRRGLQEIYKNRAAAIVSNDVASRELTRLNGYCLAPAPIDSAILVCALFPQRGGHDVTVRGARGNKL
jgi:hypothetical protein